MRIIINNNNNVKEVRPKIMVCQQLLGPVSTAHGTTNLRVLRTCAVGELSLLPLTPEVWGALLWLRSCKFVKVTSETCCLTTGASREANSEQRRECRGEDGSRRAIELVTQELVGPV